MSGSALLALRRAVADYFTTNNVSASVYLGWKPRSRQDNQGPGGSNRVVFIPGDFDPSSGEPKALKAGALDRDAPQNHVDLDPRQRAVAWWHPIVTCSVWACDPSAPQDEAGQIAATDDLFNATCAALHNAVDPVTGTAIGFGNIEEFGDTMWTLPPVESAFGRELTFRFVLLSPRFDAPTGLAYPSPAVNRNPVA